MSDFKSEYLLRTCSTDTNQVTSTNFFRNLPCYYAVWILPITQHLCSHRLQPFQQHCDKLYMQVL